MKTSKKDRNIKKERKHFDSLVESTGDVYWGNKTPAGIKRFRRKAFLIVQKLAHFRDPLVLELGCGTGALSKYVLERLPSLRLIGCDISPRAVQVATTLCNCYESARFEVADSSSLPYVSRAFDAVIGNAILHHLPIEASLSECFRVLKPGGIIWFSEPNMMNPQIALEKNIHFIGKLLQSSEDETAFFRWSLAKTLRKIGFRNVVVQPYDFLHPIVPMRLIGTADCIGRLLEKIPLLKEMAGHLLIFACMLDENKEI
jgi:ubiquinone/menaquinone biosynthesis C-methylase UbiE